MKISRIRFPARIILLTILQFSILSTSIWSQTKTDKDAYPNDRSIEQMVSQINVEVDPEFVYDYKKSKFVPPNGKTLLIMGQTVETMTEYIDNFPNQTTPGGWAAYWGIPEFKGVTSTHKNETGSSQNHQMLVDKFPNTAIQSAMWMVGMWGVANKAGKGDYDKVVKQYADWAKATNRPIYLRIGYEFDGPHNQLEPKEYIKAYRRIVKLLRKKGADNIAFVWHSYASRPYNSYDVSEWYPGDEYVDWVGISVFGHAYGGNDFGQYCDEVLSFAKKHNKPVMIAESNPIHGIKADNTEAWDKWFVHFFSFIYNKNIKAVSFINEDWQRLFINGISEWKDGRLYNNETISKAWFKETDKDRYLKQSADLFELLGYPDQ
ncbi:MAG: glycosyl hydrolase [Bacteroidota bacterium]